MIFDPARHEPLSGVAWDPLMAQEAIAWIVRATAAAYSPQRLWPQHPRDLDPGEDPAVLSTTLYFGAAGVVWALRYLEACGAAPATAAARHDLESLRELNRAWLRMAGSEDFGSYFCGDLPIELMAFADAPDAARADRLAGLIEQGIAHPARELMWGSPGGLLVASFLHERTGNERWRALFRRIAAVLRDQLTWSEEHGCHYWPQDLYGRASTYLDAVHGFVATAHVLIRGRHLLDDSDWQDWARIIVTTVTRTATWEDGLVNWRAQLIEPAGRPTKVLMQYCHGAPGFIVCLAGLDDPALDGLLLAAGEAVWAAGPLAKGSNLCHGTAGNGYAFLKLFERSGDASWLERARAFAMHAIGQARAEAQQHGQLRHSLWTGDPGLAIYLWDCLRGRAAFPTLDVFWGPPAA